MSSLAAQIAQGASLNSALLVDRSRRKATESYLFTGRDVDLHDLDSIHALGTNGLLQLASVDPEFGHYESSLFSDASRDTDRTLLPKQAVDELDRNIASLLARLGPYLMDVPTGKVLEWLVRRFRMNEFNVESILSLFLPYHESPHFAKMVTILHLKANSTWDFLVPFQKAATSLPRFALVKEMLKNAELGRFITNLLPIALQGGHSHRTLLAFNAATLHDYLAHVKSLDDGTAAYMLPALLEPLKKDADVPKDAILGSYILLATMAHKSTLTPSAVKVIVMAMTASASRVSVKQFMSAVASVCEAQGEIEDLSDKNIKAILAVSGFNQELSSAAGWVGIEKFLNPIVVKLTSNLEASSHAKVLETILIAHNPPKSTIARICETLVPLAIESSTAQLPARRLLQHAHQRYPSVLHVAVEKVGVANEDLKESLDKLVIALSMNYVYSADTHAEDADMVVAATSADSKVRVIATKNLVSRMAHDLSEADKVSVRSALLTRTQDSDASVLEVLYGQPETIVPVLLEDPGSYINQLAVFFSTSKPKRPALRVHLAFLMTHFCPKAGVKDVYSKLLFSLMLYSKPRSHSVEAVWDAIAKNLPTVGPGSFELLNGCADLWMASKADETADVQETMAAFNIAMAARIAENILSSNEFSTHVDDLIIKAGDANNHVRLLAYLIGRALVRRLTGSHQIDVTSKLVQSLCLETLSKVDESIHDADEVEKLLGNDRIGKAIVSKPNSKTTMYWLQLSLLTIAAEVPTPEGLTVNWLLERTTPYTIDDRDYRYVTLKRTLYTLANHCARHVTMNTLRVIFANLGDDALGFLTGVWLTSIDDGDLASVALGHSVAVLEAFKDSDVAVDFQTVLPSLLVALQSTNLTTRQYAQRCLSILSEGTKRKFASVYAFDVIYGSGESQLLYLSQDDLTKYLTALVEHHDHFLHDPGYIGAFHRKYLSRDAADKHKAADHKRCVLSYLASHINACGAKAQVQLLKAISLVVEESKAALLQPSVQAIKASSKASAKQTYGRNLDECLNHLASLFDKSAHRDLNIDKNGVWTTYCDFLTHLVKNEYQSATTIVFQRLEGELFNALAVERQFELCHLLLELSAQATEVHLSATKVLVGVLHDPALIVRLLLSLQPNTADAPPATKKAKTNTEPSEDSIPWLTILAEVLATVSMAGSMDVIIALVQTLNNVIQSSVSSDVVDVAFIEQSLMSAISNAAEKVTEAPNLSPAAIRLEVLVDLIRTADNPQTFQQALLLMATLARLTPDSVLHNIMPIFTFMGSNVFHRDDTYSFTVVQKTIDNIVPVMVASLKHSHTSRMELMLGSRDFLRVFTDAANHIPRHRRTHFFVHLVNVLGAEDYLAPICLLLVEKVATRVVRQNEKEAQMTFALPLSVLHHFEGVIQNKVLSEMVSESRRLGARITDPEDLEPTFLDDSLNEEHSTSATTALKRRAQAVLSFVGFAVKTTSGITTSDNESLVSLLVGMYTFKSGQGADARVDDINKVARVSLDKTLRVMPAAAYLNVTTDMLFSSEQMVQTGALELLAERLLQVSDSVRQAQTENMGKIIQRIKDLIASHPGSAVAAAALRSVKTIASSMAPGEESSLGELVPVLLSTIRNRKMALQAFSALAPLAGRLGPRIIPFFKEIVAQCVVVLDENLEDLTAEAIEVLRGLLTSIPTFWSINEISKVVLLYITRRRDDASLASVVKTISKRASAKVLIPTLTTMWSSSIWAAPSADANRLFFEVVRRSLRTSSKPVVQENIRGIFSMLLDALEAIKPQDTSATVISAFTELIVNLNENAFRPLFRRLYDWAFVAHLDDVSYRITFCHVFSALLDYFKALMTPYMSFVLTEFTTYWMATSTVEEVDATLWRCTIETTAKSMVHDDGGFWQDDKVKQVSSALLAQVPVCVLLEDENSRTLLRDTLSALVENATDDALLKTINLDLLMHTRSEDVQVRLFALTCSTAIWQAHGGKFIGFASETSTFIAECSEDENDMVCREAINLKAAVESIAGSIQGL